MNRDNPSIEIWLGGRMLDIANITKRDISIEDIGESLSKLCRFGGSSSKFYSVAQHSLLVCAMAEYVRPGDKKFAACALLHDASEAYVGDVRTPLKDAIAGYKPIEDRVHEAIRQAFALPYEKSVWQEVHILDRLAFGIEANTLLRGAAGQPFAVGPAEFGNALLEMRANNGHPVVNAPIPETEVSSLIWREIFPGEALVLFYRKFWRTV